MTTLVEPSPNSTVDAGALAAALQYAQGDFIAKADDPIYADQDNRLGSIPGSFNYDSSSSSGLDVTITTGEAIIGGHWLATDDTRTVTLDASTSNQTVYLGVDRSEPDTIIVGLDSAFSSTDYPRMAIHEFDTDSTSVTSHTNLRTLTPSDAVTSTSYSKNDADARFLNVNTGSLEGNLDFGQYRTINRAIERRTTRPSNPVYWQEWIREDKNPELHVVYTPMGYRRYELHPINVLVDGFEDQDLSEYNTSGGGTAAVTSTRAYEGTYALDVTGFKEVASFPGGGLPARPKQGDKWIFYFNINNWGNGQYRYYYAAYGSGTTASEYYDIDIYQDGTFRLQKDGNAITSSAQDYSVSYPLDTWLSVTVHWDHPDTGEHHLARLRNAETGDVLSTVYHNDAEYDGNTGIFPVGHASSDTRVHIDQMEILDRTQ